MTNIDEGAIGDLGGGARRGADPSRASRKLVLNACGGETLGKKRGRISLDE